VHKLQFQVSLLALSAYRDASIGIEYEISDVMRYPVLVGYQS